jgi:ketosteroid isomerase-like protein
VPSDRAELIRSAVDAFNQGDIDAVLEYFHPDVEIHDPERTGRTMRGWDQYRAFLGEWLEAFDEYGLRVEEIEQGSDGIFVRLIQRGRGAGSGLEFELPLHWAVRFSGEKVTYLRFTTPPEAARSEVGLPS